MSNTKIVFLFPEAEIQPELEYKYDIRQEVAGYLLDFFEMVGNPTGIEFGEPKSGKFAEDVGVYMPVETPQPLN